MNYGYTTVLSLAKRYLLNPNKYIRELPQELYMSVALFYAIPEKAENRLKFAFQVYDYCIYHGIEDIAQISKYGGGVGVYLGHIRSQ